MKPSNGSCCRLLKSTRLPMLAISTTRGGSLILHSSRSVTSLLRKSAMAVTPSSPQSSPNSSPISLAFAASRWRSASTSSSIWWCRLWKALRSTLRTGPSRELRQAVRASAASAGWKWRSTRWWAAEKVCRQKKMMPLRVSSAGASRSKKASRQSYLQNSATLPSSSCPIGKLLELLLNPPTECRRLTCSASTSRSSSSFSVASASFSRFTAANFPTMVRRRARRSLSSLGSLGRGWRRWDSSSQSGRGRLWWCGLFSAGLLRMLATYEQWTLQFEWLYCGRTTPSPTSSPSISEQGLPAMPSPRDTPTRTDIYALSDDQKTPSAILFDDEGQFLDFGSNALLRYAEILEEEGTALLFQSYKMHLLHMEAMATSVDGRQLSLLTVIEHTLRFISEQALSKLREQVGKVVLSKVRWVLTVPALWSEEHKLFMRKAAHQAGITQAVNSPALLLCLEPEGASIQCREDAEGVVREQLGRGKVVMVLDCGGGTVDITVHKLECEVEEKFLCQELLPSSGGCEWGSKYVDLYFEEFLTDFLGPDLAALYRANALARLDILRDFEIIKRKFRGLKQERASIKLSYLGEHLNSKLLKALVQQHNGRHQDHPEFHLKPKGVSNIELPAQLITSFFQPLLANIKAKVLQLVSQVEAKNHHVDFIFMVGGFSESPFLKAEIQSTFEGSNIQVLVPRRPQISVVRGACLFGLNPRSISSRIAKKTYGINTLTVWDPELHPESKKVIIEGEEFCEDVFDAFVRKGDMVSADEIHTKIYCPVRNRQTVMRIIFYETDLPDVLFIDEAHVRSLGELAIDIGKVGQSSEEKTVKVTLLFGSTHIYATATNREGTEVKNCEFRFDCHQ